MQSIQPLSDSVTFQWPVDPLFVGSYIPIPIKIEPSSGLTMEQLEFIVDPGPAAGIVSVSPESTAATLQPMILLGAGYKPGTNYTLLAREAATGQTVGKGQFAVTALWRHQTEGPSFWFTGATGGMPVGGFAWGGGASGPQNINVAPAVGTRKIAVVLIDSPTERFDPQEIPTVLQKWRNEIVDGVFDANGRPRSVAHFYREVSHFNSGPSGLNLEADFFGPVTMPTTWDNYFNSNGFRLGSTWQSMVTEANPLIDYSQYKHVIFATKSTPSWPQADWGPPTYTTAQGNLTLGVVSMPYNWDDLDQRGGGRKIHETAAHELAHNLGLGDLYSGPGDRQASRWELMHIEGGLPHFAVVHRMILGWIPANWIQTFNFAELAAPVNETVELHPVELANPPGNRKAGVEVRIADGRNYYFEYRKAEPNQIGDQMLPENNRILGTDAASYAVLENFSPRDRPFFFCHPAMVMDQYSIAARPTARLTNRIPLGLRILWPRCVPSMPTMRTCTLAMTSTQNRTHPSGPGQLAQIASGKARTSRYVMRATGRIQPGSMCRMPEILTQSSPGSPIAAP